MSKSKWGAAFNGRTDQWSSDRHRAYCGPAPPDDQVVIQSKHYGWHKRWKVPVCGKAAAESKKYEAYNRKKPVIPAKVYKPDDPVMVCGDEVDDTPEAFNAHYVWHLEQWEDPCVRSVGQRDAHTAKMRMSFGGHGGAK